ICSSISHMHPFRKQLSKNPVLKALSSVRITVVCLCLLFILTLWGTIDQVYNGLYLAQARFFNSWAFTFWGFVPFPGARLVLWVMFINLVCVALIRLVYRWSNLGITIIHSGLLLFFLAAFVTFHYVEESNITLMEGEGTNTAQAYHNWELSVWEEAGNNKTVAAFDTDRLRKGQVLEYAKFGLTAVIDTYYRNCEAYTQSDENQSKTFLNASGIKSLKPVSLDIEPQKNIPGIVFELRGADGGGAYALLSGWEQQPLTVTKGGKTYLMQLRLKRFPVPFLVKLKDFKMERHPNTEVARSYESLVEIISGGASREVL